jgi:hypothetical protein
MMIKYSIVKSKVWALNKQINKKALMMLDKHIDEYIDQIISKQTTKRITDKSIIL